jgi:surface antigen
MAALIAALFTSGNVGASSLGQQVNQLRAREASLSSQLSSLQGQAASASQRASATQQQVSTTETELAQQQRQLNLANADLASTNDQIASTQAQIVVDRSQLAELVTEMYQRGKADNLSSAIADSTDVSQLVNSALQLQTVSGKFSALSDHLLSEKSSLTTLKQAQTVQQQHVAGLVFGLQTKSAQLQTQESIFRQQASSLSGQAGQLAGEIQADSNQVQSLEAEEVAVSDYGGSAGAEEGTILQTYSAPTGGYATNPDSYPWGQCTWYVATQTDVPWAPAGNADQWVSEDISTGAYGWGSTPRADSMVIFDPGGAYDPYFGHVAWVVAVVSPTTFIVREGNFLGLGMVDEREIYTLQGVEGFIYG